MPDASRRSRPSIPAAALVAAALLAAPADGRAEDSNFRPYLVGSRAAGMGGAFTALADDGSGPFYNPAGIAFVRRSQLSLSGSVYGVASGTIRDALGDGHDFKHSTLQTLPTATAGVFKVGEDRPDASSAIALTVYVPDAVFLDGRDSVGLQQNAFLLSSQAQTVWAGLTYARRWGRIALGASGFFLFGTAVDQLDLSVLESGSVAQLNCPTPYACATLFRTITSRSDATTYGFVGAIGARWDATDQLRIGVAVYSPEVGFGTRRMFLRIAQPASPGTLPVVAAALNADGLHASPSMPLRAQLGAAWTSGRFTLSADATYLASREVVDDAEKADLGLSRRIVRNAVLNGAIGAEYVVAGRFPLRAGLFTDFSSANAPVATLPGGSDPNPSNPTKIDRFGGTLSIGLRTEHTATDLGVMISGGSGKDLVPSNLDFTQLRPTDASQLFTYLFLGTSYEF